MWLEVWEWKHVDVSVGMGVWGWEYEDESAGMHLWEWECWDGSMETGVLDKYHKFQWDNLYHSDSSAMVFIVLSL